MHVVSRARVCHVGTASVVHSGIDMFGSRKTHCKRDLVVTVFSSVRLMRRPLLCFGPHATETASRRRPWKSWGALGSHFVKKIILVCVSEGSCWVLGVFGVQGVRTSPGRRREVPGRFGGVLEGPLDTFIFFLF